MSEIKEATSIGCRNRHILPLTGTPLELAGADYLGTMSFSHRHEHKRKVFTINATVTCAVNQALHSSGHENIGLQAHFNGSADDGQQSLLQYEFTISRHRPATAQLEAQPITTGNSCASHIAGSENYCRYRDSRCDRRSRSASTCSGLAAWAKWAIAISLITKFNADASIQR